MKPFWRFYVLSTTAALMLSCFFGNSTAATRAVTMTINASIQVHAFNPMMRGGAFGTWTWGWGKPLPTQLPKFEELTRPIKPGVLRFAGGLGVNGMSWTRLPGIIDMTYYRPAEIADVVQFAKDVGAEVMIQVNIVNNDPAMWADMVRYCNVEHDWKIKYWELGNELDYDDKGVTPENYATRFIAYRRAMQAVDSTILLCGPTTANFGSNPDGQTWYPPLIAACKTDGKDLEGLTYHWYQTFGETQAEMAPTPSVILNYSTSLTSHFYPYTGTPPQFIQDDHWLLMNRRRFSEYCLASLKNRILADCPNTFIGITELGTNAGNGEDQVFVRTNFVGALWLGDILGRLAYNGCDLATWWELYDGEATFSIIGSVNTGGSPHLFLWPAYYAYFMYAQYFGTMMVQSASTDYANPASPSTSKKNEMGIWASTDSHDSGKVKLMLVNLSADTCAATISITGYSPTAGHCYELTNSHPIATDTAYNSSTAINGVHLNENAIATSMASIAPIPLTSVGATFTRTVRPYSLTGIILSNGQVGINDVPGPKKGNQYGRLPAGKLKVEVFSLKGELMVRAMAPASEILCSPVKSDLLKALSRIRGTYILHIRGAGLDYQLIGNCFFSEQARLKNLFYYNK